MNQKKHLEAMSVLVDDIAESLDEPSSRIEKGVAIRQLERLHYMTGALIRHLQDLKEN